MFLPEIRIEVVVQVGFASHVGPRRPLPPDSAKQSCGIPDAVVSSAPSYRSPRGQQLWLPYPGWECDASNIHRLGP
jgi:hypothetical protein